MAKLNNILKAFTFEGARAGKATPSSSCGAR